MNADIKYYYSFVRPDLIKIPDYKYKYDNGEFPFPTITTQEKLTALLIKYLGGYKWEHVESYTRLGDITFLFEIKDN